MSVRLLLDQLGGHVQRRTLNTHVGQNTQLQNPEPKHAETLTLMLVRTSVLQLILLANPKSQSLRKGVHVTKRARRGRAST
jgi:hypothetical protein